MGVDAAAYSDRPKLYGITCASYNSGSDYTNTGASPEKAQKGKKNVKNVVKYSFVKPTSTS